MSNSTIKTQTPTQPQPFSAEQRKGMAHLLADAKKRVEEGFESTYELNSRIEAEMVPKLAKERGATPFIEKARRLRKEFKETEMALGKLGFACDGDAEELSLVDEAPKELSEALEHAQRAARKERDDEVRKYDKAILRVWAAEDAAEARKIVEEVL